MRVLLDECFPRALRVELPGHEVTTIAEAKKPFPKDVILRLDFGSRVEAFIRALPQKVATAALQRFPLSEPQKAQMQEITFSATALQTKTEDLKHFASPKFWALYGALPTDVRAYPDWASAT